MRLLGRVRFCRSTAGLPPGTIVFFPVDRCRLPCGLAGIVEVVGAATPTRPDASACESALRNLAVTDTDRPADEIDAVCALIDELRLPSAFPTLVTDGALQGRLEGFAKDIRRCVTEAEEHQAGDVLPDLATQEEINRRVGRLKDAAWAIEHELLPNVTKVVALAGGGTPNPKAIREYRKANLILNAVDRLEIRGRDSAGILFQVHFPKAALMWEALTSHRDELGDRTDLPDLPNGSIAISDDGRTATFAFKVAAEVGKLGDNVAALKRSVSTDGILRDLVSHPESEVVVMAHTRWASNGIINVANCHPLDNGCAEETAPPKIGEEEDEGRSPRIHVALNGDIDNHLDIRARFEEETGRRISDRITTDAKVIALWIDRYLRRGEDLDGAFRKAVADFEGSAAISMVSDLAPGRMYLSLKGSGQSLYVGLAPAGFIVASEIYGLVEETSRFVKLEGERERVPGDEKTRGQVFVLDGRAGAGIGAVRAEYHDGTPAPLEDGDVRRAEITTRDVDRGDHPHYFLKEVSQASSSVERTLRGKFTSDGRMRMGEEVIPAAVSHALSSGDLQRIVVVGQGTASIAAMAIAAFCEDFLSGAGVPVEAMKASELSGFGLVPDMSRTLVVAVTQSGATADTNRAVDLVRERGAHVIAVVNRRNSDITFKASGVLYTSDGRDVEMSVASTKAFYSQVVAGALLGLAFGLAAGTLDDARVVEELADLRRLPVLLDEVFGKSEEIARAAERLAPIRRYWTVVGSGPNRIAAEEVRIKLSELCYKSISADSVEDKKHIDLSAEALILVLAAGNHDAVLSDLAKDVAIFKAHRALPVVFATRGETRFDEYASAVIEIPPASPLLSMVLCTMAGHLFGYHAARAIDEGGRFLARLRGVVVAELDRPRAGGAPEIGRFASEYRQRLRSMRYASALEADTASELLILLKYASGEIPPVAFAEEYGREPEPAAIQATLLETLVEAIDETLRPIDAIKHQAKIVTVGTSRPTEKPTGILFDALADAGVELAAITFADRALLDRIQIAVAGVGGMTRYAVSDLAPDGSPGEATRVAAVERTGTAAGIPSRAEGGAPLKGTKRSVVQDRRAFVGIGAKDGRKIAILPLVDHRFAVNALVLLHLTFRDSLPVSEIRRALGEKYDEIVNGVTEADVPWSDDLLLSVPTADLFTTPPARVAEGIIARRAE